MTRYFGISASLTRLAGMLSAARLCDGSALRASLRASMRLSECA